jgi:hypothetical protein
LQGISAYLLSLQKRGILQLVVTERLLGSGNIERQEEVMEQSFEAFGSRIVLVHAKDFIFDGETDSKFAKPHGKGILNIRRD